MISLLYVTIVDVTRASEREREREKISLKPQSDGALRERRCLVKAGLIRRAETDGVVDRVAHSRTHFCRTTFPICPRSKLSRNFLPSHAHVARASGAVHQPTSGGLALKLKLTPVSVTRARHHRRHTADDNNDDDDDATTRSRIPIGARRLPRALDHPRCAPAILRLSLSLSFLRPPLTHSFARSHPRPANHPAPGLPLPRVPHLSRTPPPPLERGCSLGWDQYEVG